MKFSYWMSRRLPLRSGGARGGKAGATGVVIAVAGVALAIVIMEITLAVVTGFKREIRNKLSGFEAQIIVLPEYDYDNGVTSDFLEADSTLMTLVGDVMPDVSVSAALRMPGMLKTDDNFAALIYTAHSSGHDDTFERSCIVEGDMPDFTDDTAKNMIVISKSVALDLGLSVGDKVYSCFFADGSVRMRRNTVAAIYCSDFGEYDRNVLFASPAMLRGVVSRSPDTASRLEITGVPQDSIRQYADRLQAALINACHRGEVDGIYPVTDVMRVGIIYYNWLELLDTNVLIIFILMLCVAAFTLISSLFILILERVSAIGILRALGADKKCIQSIFVLMAMRIVGMGIIVGNVIGIGVILLQQHTHLVSLDPEMYYLKYVPVVIEPVKFVLLNIGIIVASWLVLVLPSRLASRLAPATTAGYE